MGLWREKTLTLEPCDDISSLFEPSLYPRLVKLPLMFLSNTTRSVDSDAKETVKGNKSLEILVNYQYQLGFRTMILPSGLDGSGKSLRTKEDDQARMYNTTSFTGEKVGDLFPLVFGSIFVQNQQR